jgi:hypothetical protein
MNLAQMVNRFMQDYGEPNYNKFPLSLIKEWFDEAQRVINKETKCIHKTSLVTAVNNQRVYSYPTDILDNAVDDVFYGDDPNNTEMTPLLFISIENLKLLDDDFYTATGSPTHWYHDQQEGKLALYPFEASVSNGVNKIKINYRAKHTKMTRLYSTGTVTVSASVSVTGSGTVFLGNAIAGDSFGVGALLSRTTEFPSDFFTIEAIGGNTSLTLTSAYSGAAGSSLSFITASTSSFTDDELNMACVLYVMGLAYRKDKELQLYADFTKMAVDKAVAVQYDVEKHPAKCTFQTPSGTSQAIINDYSEVYSE